MSLSATLSAAFDEHTGRLSEKRKRGQEEVAGKSLVETFEPVDEAEGDVCTEELGSPHSSDVFGGDRRMRTLRTLLALVDDRGYERSSQQVEFHDNFINACGRILYREDWVLNKPEILKCNGWGTSFSEVLISTPRRFGKTFAVAIFIAVVALSVPLEVVVFSPARRASRKLLERVHEFIRLLDSSDRITEYNQEVLRVRSYDEGKTSLVRSFPSKVGSLKGVSGNLIILEEAAYCDQGLVSEVIVPLLSMQESVLLCISTLLDGSNHYSKMFELQNDKGEQLFKTIAITLVCDECAASAHPELCTHKLGSLPRWISSSKVETVRTLLSEDPAMILRETLGIAADGSNKAYSHDDVSAMMNMKPLPVRIDPRRSNENQACSADAHFSPCNNPRPTFPAYVQMYFFVAVDPSGGGPSAFSIASILLTKEAQHQVLGVEALVTKDVRDTHKLLLTHIMQVRKANPFLATATAVIALESNLGFESQHLLHALKESHLPRWIALAEGPKGTIGLHTTADRKEQYCLLYREVLRQRRIVFSDAFFSLSMEPEEARKRLKEETLNFSVVVEPPKSSFGRSRKTYTGKLGGKQDDTVLALQMCLYSIKTFYSSDRYKNFRVGQGI